MFYVRSIIVRAQVLGVKVVLVIVKMWDSVYIYISGIDARLVPGYIVNTNK